MAFKIAPVFLAGKEVSDSDQFPSKALSITIKNYIWEGNMYLSKKNLVIISVVILSLILVWAVQAEGEQIYACVRSNGGVRILLEGETECKNNEQLMTWNIQGLPGPQGEPGPEGPAGPAGPPGTTSWYGLTDIPDGFSDGTDEGLTGWEMVVEDFTLPGHDLRSVLIWCPYGKVVLGGGFDVPKEVQVTHSGPNPASSYKNQWYIHIYNTTGDPQDVQGYAICAYGD
jgi:hypothetical protein